MYDSHLTLIRRMLFPLLLLIGSPPVYASWWSHDWSFRKQINLSPQDAGVSADVNNAVVLVRLHEGVMNFADANADGSDIRFVAGDDKTPLHYHIERFDNVFNLGFAWVQVPQLKAGAPTPIYMYYGNAKATADSRASETYDPDQLLVYHFAEKGAPPADSSSFKHNAMSAALPDDNGLIGGSGKFEGTTVVALPSSPSLNLTAGQNLTVSMWVKPAQAQDAVLYTLSDAARNAFTIGLAGGAPYVALQAGGAALGRAQGGAVIADGSWHHIAVVAAPQLSLYVDGTLQGTVPAALPAIAGSGFIGGESLTPQQGYRGELDEFGIAKAARPLAAMQMAANNQGAGTDKLVVFGGDEAQSSFSTGYFGIILGSVTLDGWVVIGVLVVMMLISWAVMAIKGRQIGRAAKGNTAFLQAFKAANGDYHALREAVMGSAQIPALNISEDDIDLMRDAPATRLFTTGIDELRSRLTGENGQRGRNDVLSEQSIEAIRASIEASFIRESQILSSRMVLLTIAISGGPFIGLLGTVVGVMITFAAVAAAGDVNVNAIAPGIAAALAATVAGLFVAIPALFGYNYLLTRVKECTAEMQVFINAFVTRLAESYHQPAALHAMAD